MKLVISLVFLLKSIDVLGCRLRPGKYVSLSAPISMLWSKLDLNHDPSWKGISVFHKVSSFSGEIMGGGLFLSQKTLAKYKSSLIFFDYSRELQSILEKANITKKVSIISRELDLFQMYDESIKQSYPYLVDCEKKIKQLEKKKSDLLNKIMTFQKKLKVYFALGLVEKDKLPELLMVNDGIAKTFSLNQNISTYPSNLSYVRWSEKVFHENKPDLIIGLDQDDKLDKIKIKKISKSRYNITGPSLLLPGVAQFELAWAILKLLREFK